MLDAWWWYKVYQEPELCPDPLLIAEEAGDNNK